MDQNKLTPVHNSSAREDNGDFVIAHLEEHLRPLADHQGVGMPHWYYW